MFVVICPGRYLSVSQWVGATGSTGETGMTYEGRGMVTYP